MKPVRRGRKLLHVNKGWKSHKNNAKVLLNSMSSEVSHSGDDL